jgi:hypothetical protein
MPIYHQWLPNNRHFVYISGSKYLNIMRELVKTADYARISEALFANPALANEGWPYDEKNTQIAHPLHRICDLVYSGDITDEQAERIAGIFLEAGANVNGYGFVLKKDTPLLAASSLHADRVALLYMAHGADIHHQGCHGGTALHWAAWCGRDIVVRQLLERGAAVNQRCIDFASTPLFWSVMAYTQGNDPHHQLACIQMLLEAGADKSIPNSGGKTVFDMAEGFGELEGLLGLRC